mgnify:CR=1 FL=1|tara:strand:- start:36 stop:1154 length:1119 start_codon:yes stop_codon:yes gene_type:complete
MVQNLKHNLEKKNKVRLAVIGGSFDSTIGKTHLRSILASSKYEITCGCFSKKKIKNVKNSSFYSLPKNKIYNDLDNLLRSEIKNIDLALIITPPKNRRKIYSKIIKKKIGIIAEKPFEANIKEAKKSYKIIKKKKVFFASTYNYLGYPAIMEIKNLIKKLGKINNFVFEMPQQSSTFYKSTIKKWRTRDELIPNLHLDLASHLLSLVYYFFDQMPSAVNSFETKNKNYTDNVYTWLRFKKFVGQFWFSKNSTGKKNELSIRIFGTKGSVEWKHSNSEEIIFSDNKGNQNIINRLSQNTEYLKDIDLFTYSPGHPSGFLDAFINIYKNIFETFYKKEKKSKILINLKKNLDIIKVLDKIHYSSLKKNWQKIDL